MKNKIFLLTALFLLFFFPFLGFAAELDSGPGIKVNIINHQGSLLLGVVILVFTIFLLIKKRSAAILFLALGVLGLIGHGVLDFIFHSLQQNKGPVAQELLNIVVHWGAYVMLAVSARKMYLNNQESSTPR